MSRFPLPPFILRLFQKANQASYLDKKRYFYPFKHRFLRHFGVLDGWDLQIIERPCLTCHDGWPWFDDEFGSECPDCGGSGIFSRKEYRLQRYRLGNSVYHVPEGLLEEPLKGEMRELIRGVIDHPKTVEPDEGWRSLVILLFIFSPVQAIQSVWVPFKWWIAGLNPEIQLGLSGRNTVYLPSNISLKTVLFLAVGTGGKIIEEGSPRIKFRNKAAMDQFLFLANTYHPEIISFDADIPF